MAAYINDSNAVFFLLNNDSIIATFEGFLSVSVSQYSGMFSAVSSLPRQFIGKTRGLLGMYLSFTVSADHAAEPAFSHLHFYLCTSFVC